MSTQAPSPLTATVPTADILARIVAHKRSVLPTRKALLPPAALEAMPGFQRQTLSLVQSLRNSNGSGIIAEFKRRSPSKGTINDRCDVCKVAAGYEREGAAAISVLTDEVFFGGTAEDLLAVRSIAAIPLLRKDFVVDEYQILEARALGADLILLIAACLTPADVRRLAAFAHALGLEVLLELHAEEELAHVCPDADLIGINNRDLRTFQVDVERSLRMAAQLPPGRLLVAESGIDSPEQIARFRQHGFQGFLVGERFMKAEDPVEAFRLFRTGIDRRGL